MSNKEKYTPDPNNSLSCTICGADTEEDFRGVPLCVDCICDMQEGSSDRIIEAVKNHYINPRDHDIEHILAEVAHYTGISIDEIKNSKNQRRELTEARQIAQYISRNNKCGSLKYIGSEIGHKDHVTVMHSIKTVKNLLNDKEFRKKYIKLIDYYE